MKSKHYLSLFLFTIATIGLIGCSKGKKGDIDDLEKTSGLTMKVDGVVWKSTMTTLFSESHLTSESGEYYLIYISGTKVIEYNKDDVDDDLESVNMYITIPASKFKNPKGSYPVVLDESKPNHSWAAYSGAKTPELFVSHEPGNPNQSVGNIEIKGFEIGEQKILGQSTGKEGYVKLSGNFHFKLATINGNQSVNITEGEFDIDSGFGFGN